MRIEALRDRRGLDGRSVIFGVVRPRPTAPLEAHRLKPLFFFKRILLFFFLFLSLPCRIGLGYMDLDLDMDVAMKSEGQRLKSEK